MKLTVYLDVLIVMNTLINYILLKISALLGQIPYNTRNIMLSSLTGALFSSVIFLDINTVLSLCIKTISVTVCTCLAFGFVSWKYFIKNSICVLLSTFIFTGLLYAFPADNSFLYLNNFCYYININPLFLVLCIGCIYMVLQAADFVFSQKNTGNKMVCTLTIDGREITATAFYDTGFGVRDILGHRAVMLCSLPPVKNSLDRPLVSVLEDFLAGNLRTDIGLFHVFYSDISKQGILPAIRPQAAVLNGKEIKNVIIAFTDKTFSDDVQIIFGKDIFEMTGE
ncbi:MAG: sigma-E processing peptidase SpoIIGA [Oscillospiraceae bacterium]|nr:sigma-E processing peptidase SpoIIGA [Oscillospiraceae bacterium]